MKYYCIGIKGAGMSTLAQILYDLGNDVCGYDDALDHKFTEDGLIERGIKIYYDNSHELDKDMIVTYSKAFSETHKEIVRVKELGLQTKQYNDVLGDLTRMFKTIGVSGTHGKTTTSSLITHILNSTIGCNYFIGDGSGHAVKDNQLFVLESCEYQRHFLSYDKEYAIVTNIELEHTECYDGILDIIKTFEIFANGAKKKIIACGDDENVRKMNLVKDTIYYGFDEQNDVVAKNIITTQDGSEFDVFYHNNYLEHFKLPLYGNHMILDFLACLIVCREENVEIETIKKLLPSFKNARRRFKETIIDDIVVIDDYAHHPTEIKVTLEAARAKYKTKKLVAVFIPNTYSRTKEMTREFIDALKIADEVYLTDIKSNRETKEQYPNVSSDLIIDNLPNGHKIEEMDISKLVEYKDAILCFMSCANISHMIDDYIKTKRNSL